MNRFAFKNRRDKQTVGMKSLILYWAFKRILLWLNCPELSNSFFYCRLRNAYINAFLVLNEGGLCNR